MSISVPDADSPAGSTPVAAGADAPEASSLAPGTLIAERYRIEALLGSGGMGAVYRAEHVHMRKHLAVKVLHAGVTASAEAAARFEREAVAAGNINHPNVAAATDFGRLPDGSLYLVLEYIDGKSLRKLSNEQRLPPARAIAIVRDIASALAAAHALGIIHRDLKPENVMIVERPTADVVKVLDFGIAKVNVDVVSGAGASGASDKPAQPLTRMGAVFGTPDYMSPEQGLGQPVDHRSDLYSLGVMLYELLAGQRPFQGGTVTVIRQHVLDDPPPLAPDVLGAIDPRVDGVLRRLLAKQPADRMASAQELCEELAAVLRAPGPPPSAVVVQPAGVPELPVASAKEQAVVPTLAVAAADVAAAATPSPTPPPAATSTPPAAAPSRRTALVAGAAALGLVVLVGLAWALSHAFGGGATATSATVDDPSAASASADDTASAPSASGTAPIAAQRAGTGVAAAHPTAASANGTSPTPTPTPTPTPNANAGSNGNTNGASVAEAPHGKPGKAEPQHGHGKNERSTGPGGIYIPPPDKWFK